MISNTSFNRILLTVQPFSLDGLYNSFCRFLYSFFTVQLLMNIVYHLLVAFVPALSVLIIQPADLAHGSAGFLSLRNSVVTLFFELMISDCVITILTAYDGICSFLNLALQLILR